jgi:hypothetical protein
LKKVVSVLFAIMVMAVFTGCTGSQNGSADFSSIATNEEIAAVESSLILDRLMASESIAAVSADVLAATSGSTGGMRYRNRYYKTENYGQGFGLSRGDGSCMTMVSGDNIVIGTEQATVEKLESGAIRITRGNGSVIETPAMVSGEITSFEVGGIEWQATFGETSEDPLVILKNLRSGMILRVTELDDGTITIVRDSSEVFVGRWSEDGSLQLADGNGKMYRYRYGRNI